ncbi:MAG: histidine phosphatase family protein [Oscillospiraceae bacterium]|nr:histidine phosphatase family protein [Oscillospiraceae bacterium]
MRLLLIRHGDPDYSIDSLTEKGHREAELLAERIAPMDIKAYYTSPLGRAKKTAEYTLDKIGRTAEVLDWAREFDVPVDDGNGGKRIAWDFLPEDWRSVPDYYDRDRWTDVKIMKDADIKAGIEKVHNGLDRLLERHGYRREGEIYRAVSPNEDTAALFCHFGVTCVMLSHLLGVSPMVLWHGTIAAPTSVTTLVTEERREGKAVFRMTAFGDISHLYMQSEPPAFAGRFCEMYSNKEQRHD